MSTEAHAKVRRALAWGLALSLCACGDAARESSAPGGVVPAASAWQPGQLPARTVSGEPSCPLAGTVRDCACGAGTSGKQTCLAEGWSSCACAVVPSGAAGGTAPMAGAGGGGAVEPAVSEPVVEEEPPTGVVFDWPETDPDDVVACEPGHYVGMFSCDLRIVTNDGMPAFELSGTVDMHLEQTEDGELLRIENGTFASAAAVAIPAWGDIVGELDCSSGRFDGRLENGRFSVALGLPVPFTEGTFMGDLGADYDPEAQALGDGTWNMVGQLDLFPGSCTDGTWNATRVGP